MPTRSLLILVLGSFLLSPAANALTQGPINCIPFPTTFPNGTGGPNAVMCVGFNVPGGVVTAVTLNYAADYQFGSANGTNTVQVTFVPNGPGGVTWNQPSTTLTVSGGQSSGAIQTGSASAASGISTAAFSLPFNVNVSSTVTAGTVATSSGAVSVTYTYNPPAPLNLICPASTGTVGTAYNSFLQAIGGVPAYTFSITSGALPNGLTLNPLTGAITGTPTTAGPFNFTGQVVDSIGGVAGTATASCLITISNIPPPPPPTGACANSAGAVVFPLGNIAPPENSFLVRYVSNLDRGDSFVNITNYGLNGAPPQGPGFGPAVGNLCVNVYTFSPDEQLVSCCSCLVTPNALASLSVNADLLNSTLTQVVPTSGMVKLVASDPATGALLGGMSAWGTTLHQTPAAGTFGLTETPFSRATLSAGELASISGRCAAIIGNGSGHGICKTCRSGGLGASQ